MKQKLEELTQKDKKDDEEWWKEIERDEESLKDSALVEEGEEKSYVDFFGSKDTTNFLNKFYLQDIKKEPQLVSTALCLAAFEKDAYRYSG